MTTSSGNPSGLSSGINMTPMIDVLLVLLIIFMVIVPAMPRGESAKLPSPSHASGSKSDEVVLEVLQATGGRVSYRINRQTVSRSELPTRLAEVYANRAERVLFVKGDDRLSFTQIAEAIDIGHAAGAGRVGLMTPGLSSAGR